MRECDKDITVKNAYPSHQNSIPVRNFHTQDVKMKPDCGAWLQQGCLMNVRFSEAFSEALRRNVGKLVKQKMLGI